MAWKSASPTSVDVLSASWFQTKTGTSWLLLAVSTRSRTISHGPMNQTSVALSVATLTGSTMVNTLTRAQQSLFQRTTTVWHAYMEATQDGNIKFTML